MASCKDAGGVWRLNSPCQAQDAPAVHRWAPLDLACGAGYYERALTQQDELLVGDLNFRYPPVTGLPHEPVLRGAAFALPQGEMGLVLASADAGKTTLARILAGLVPRFTGGQLAGSIECGGHSVRSLKPFELLDRIGMIFQDSEEQLVTSRCDTEVAFALESLGVPRAEIVEKVGRSLSLVGLSGFASRYPSSLSGGEKKRLLIACLSAIDPAIWVLDESLEELDLVWRRRLLEQLSASGRTVLMLDSRWSPAYAGRCGRTWMLKDGLIADAGEGGALFEEGVALGTVDRPLARCSGDVSAVLRAEQVEFSFPAAGAFDIRVESLALRKGEICSLVGPNGSGKTTLGRLLCGLHRPSSGTISLENGGSFRPSTAEDLNRRIGYLFQNPDHQIYLPTVRDELAAGLKLAGIGGRDRARLIGEALELFELPGPEAPPALLGFGARRRLQAATYYLLERDILILDEVDCGLSYGALWRLLEALCRKGSGIVLITHDLDLARAVSRRIILIKAGRIQRELSQEEFGSIEQAMGEEP